MAIRSSSYEDEFMASLTDPKEAAAYLDAARKDSRDSLLVALRDVAQAHKMAKVAEEAAVDRASLYRMLNAGGNPTLDSFDSVLRAVGLTFRIIAIQKHQESERPEPHEAQGRQASITPLDSKMIFRQVRARSIKHGWSKNTPNAGRIAASQPIRNEIFELPLVATKEDYGYISTANC